MATRRREARPGHHAGDAGAVWATWDELTKATYGVFNEQELAVLRDRSARLRPALEELLRLATIAKTKTEKGSK